jgi:hypothetical protein
MTKTDDKNNQKNKRSFLIVIALLILITGIIIVWRSIETPRGEAVTMIIEGSDGQDILPKELKPLGDIILTNYREYRNNTIRWSAAYFSCLFLSAAFSALAGFILKVKSFSNSGALKEDLAALLAMLAALLITLSTVGDFQRKWAGNRIAASEVESLAYDLIKTPFTEDDKAKVISKLQEISATRNRGIVGEDKSVADSRVNQKGDY